MEAQAGNTSEAPIQRRSFLNICLGASMTAFGGVAFYAGGSYLLPPGAFSAEVGGESIRIPLSELPIGGAKMFRYKGKPSVVVRLSDKNIRALSAVCTHLGCIVKWDSSKQQLVCPCHVAAFDVNGNVVSGPAPGPLQSINTKIAQDEIIIGDA